MASRDGSSRRHHTTAHRVRRTTAVVLGLLVLATGCGSADGGAEDGSAAGSIRVEDAWVRATTDAEDPTMTAAFFNVYNDTAQDVELVGAESAVAGMAEIHEMAMVDGQSVMRAVDGGVTITAGRGKTFEPGGYHVMLMRLAGPLEPGEEVRLTLTFSDGTSTTLSAPVKQFTEEEGHYHAPGTDDDHAHTPTAGPSSDGM